ncbi:hypothetical protein TNCV_691781 [Trichonephila clavipes]|nr:hypothetical protein TNCV_691781 [Trichonephila clavipes]
MPKKKCALRKGVTKWLVLEESVANWVLENRLNGLIVTRNSVRLFALKWSKKNAFSCYPTMKVHKKQTSDLARESLNLLEQDKDDFDCMVTKDESYTYQYNPQISTIRWVPP